MGQVVVAETYMESHKQGYRDFLSQVGQDIAFESDKWVCDAYLRNPSDYMSKVTISFKTTPEPYKEMMKYFAIIRLLNGIHPVGIKGMVNGVAKFLVYTIKQGTNPKIEQLTPSTASKYKCHLDELMLSESSKSSLWQSVHVFLKEMNGFENTSHKNPFVINPFMECKRHAYKYIPEDVLKRLDQVFYTEMV